MTSSPLRLFLFLACMPLGAAAAAPDRQVTFWHIQTYQATRAVVDGAVERFRKGNPGVRVNVVALAADDLKEKLRQADAAGAGFPDVFHTWGGGILGDYVRAGRARVLPETPDGILPAALAFCRADGKTAAVPADIAVVLFWYNRDLFARHGIEVPRTQAELLAACGKLRAAGVCPIAVGNKDRWPGAFFYMYLALRAGGPGPFRQAAAGAPGASFEHPSFVRAGALLQQMVEARVFPEGFNSMTYESARRLFFDGRAAMMLMGTWLPANCLSEAPAFLPKMDCFAYPAVADGCGDGAAVVGGVNAAYAMSADCAEPEAAMALIRELASAETAGAWARTGRIPARVPGAEAWPFPSAAARKAAAIRGEADFIQHYYDQALPPKLAARHKETTQALFALEMTPGEAARVMDRARTGQRGPAASGHLVPVVIGAALLALVVLAGSRLRKRGAARGRGARPGQRPLSFRRSSSTGSLAWPPSC
jgi:raffinose/stachyose/melibiose transport system substrate-binding protein